MTLISTLAPSTDRVNFTMTKSATIRVYDDDKAFLVRKAAALNCRPADVLHRLIHRIEVAKDYQDLADLYQTEEGKPFRDLTDLVSGASRRRERGKAK